MRQAARMNVFERYLSLWVAACMVLGVAIGKLAPGLVGAMRDMEFGTGSHINIPIAILIWLMIYPMMLKIDFASIRGVGKRPGGLAVTLVVNWLVKPFSMAFLGWLFFRHVFTPWIGPELASEYIAGVIILAAAPCTAMVFVWSYLSDGDPAYTLVQVAVNDLIMLVVFAPVVKFLVSGRLRPSTCPSRFSSTRSSSSSSSPSRRGRSAATSSSGGRAPSGSPSASCRSSSR